MMIMKPIIYMFIVSWLIMIALIICSTNKVLKKEDLNIHYESNGDSIQGDQQVSLCQIQIVMKQIFDRVLAFVAVFLLSPFLLLISICIYIDDPGPVLFLQKRVGKNKKLFMIHKFRTMKMSTPHDQPTHLLENPSQYITRVGKFLRKVSLDELPQVWDILIGKMSFVGPRPALWNQYDLILERDKYNANDILPGLTGWAQINGRDELEINVKAKLDGFYVEHMSFNFDIKCLFKTFLKVIKCDGVVEGMPNQEGK